jgi:hypothetical protein
MDESGIEATQALDFGDYDDDATDDEQSENTPVSHSLKIYYNKQCTVTLLNSCCILFYFSQPKITLIV